MYKFILTGGITFFMHVVSRVFSYDFGVSQIPVNTILFRTLHFGDSTMIEVGLRNPLESEVLFSVTKILIFFEVLIRALVSIANFVTMYKFL